MKTINIISVLGLLFTFISCDFTIKGEGKIIAKDTLLHPFKTITLKGNYQAILIKDSITSVRIETNENLLDNIIINNDDNKLTLNERKSTNEYDIYKITITTPNIEEINVLENVQCETSGQINQEKLEVILNDNAKFMGNIFVSDLNLVMKANSNANFTGSAANANLQLNENAVFLSPIFNISNAKCTLEDNAEAIFTILKSIEGEGSGNSKLIYQGTPERNYNIKDLAIFQQGK